jgi:hypothetical protein
MCLSAPKPLSRPPPLALGLRPLDAEGTISEEVHLWGVFSARECGVVIVNEVRHLLPSDGRVRGGHGKSLRSHRRD